MTRMTAAGIFGALSLLLAGCVSIGKSQASRHYVLSSPSAAPATSGEGRGLYVGVIPVQIPTYLDRPHLVTRKSPHEIDVATFERWGEPLASGITRLVSDRLAETPTVSRIADYPFLDRDRVDYALEIAIERFDGTLGGEAVLICRWSILKEGSVIVSQQESEIRRPIGGEEYADFVGALSETLVALSAEIETALSRLPAE